MSKQTHTSLLLALTLLMVAIPAMGALDNTAPSNYPPRLVVAVLPFENVTRDAAADDWQLALPALIRSCLGEAEFVSLPDSKRVQQTLKRTGWTTTNSLDAAMVQQLARDLKARLLVCGQFRRESNSWAVDVKALWANSEKVPVKIQATATGWVDLAESVSLNVAKQLGRQLAEDDLEVWRRHMPHNEKAANGFAKAICLTISDAPLARQEAAWREVLAADSRCGAAHVFLIQTLSAENREADSRQAVTEFLHEIPGLCRAHVIQAQLLLTTRKEAQAEAEAEALEGLRLHRGCPDATRWLFRLLAPANRWTDLVSILKEALANRPDAELTRVLLADALVQKGNREEGRAVLEPLETLTDLPEGSEVEELILCQAACAVAREDLAGLTLLRLNSQAQTNDVIRKWLEAPVTVTAEEPGSAPPIGKPRSLKAAELNAELEQRLTGEERSLVINPVEITPEVRAEAHRLTAWITNEYLRAYALFAEVAQRGLGSGDGGRRTAIETMKALEDPETRLSCQEHAKLFVAFARALGLEAWIAHIDRCADGTVGYHDCAALFLNGRGVLVDPAWGRFGVPHQEFTVLNDVQAISHQAMQGGSRPDPRRLWMGLKLNPDDRWTRLQFVRHMAWAGELDAAAEELRKVRSTGEQTWDVHEATAVLEGEQKHWKSALDALQRALALSPSNAAVHFELASVYSELNDLARFRDHLETALRLNRGEFSRELYRQSQNHVALLTAVLQGQTGGPEAGADLQRRAEAGDSAAQLALAKICFDAKPPRIEEGMRWLSMAANAGELTAAFEYGRNLLLLRGKEAAKEAMGWLARPANRGHAPAQYLFGLTLYEGKLVPRDNVPAAQWIYLAADQGHPEARHLLKELALFLAPAELAEARKRADDFKALKERLSAP